MFPSVTVQASNYSKRGTCEALNVGYNRLAKASNYSKRGTCEAGELTSTGKPV